MSAERGRGLRQGTRARAVDINANLRLYSSGVRDSQYRCVSLIARAQPLESSSWVPTEAVRWYAVTCC